MRDVHPDLEAGIQALQRVADERGLGIAIGREGFAEAVRTVLEHSTSRNLVSAEQAESNRERGGLTFNAMPPDDYDGMMMVFAAVRLGDHAHVEIQSGRWLGTGPSHRGTNEGSANVGLAGRIVLRWHEWTAWRDLMDTTTPYRIAEVEKPTQGMLDRYVTVAPPDTGKEIFT
jgi:hypothetical protein